MAHILVIDDESKMTYLVENALADGGFSVKSTNSPKEALELIEIHSFDIVVTDFSMPDINGLDILKKVKAKGDAEVIIMTAYGSVQNAVEAMKEGAADYIVKPFPMDELLILCRKLDYRRRLSGLSDMLTSDLKKISYDEFIGESKAAQQLLDMISKVAASEATVLLSGKSGTGKELAAHLVHQHSPRRNNPFIPVNCAALTETLLESELFGHEKGAFTGAVARKLGRFELADGGTIFLDEIGETSPALQAKLLRVIEEKQFVRVGGVDNVKSDVRIIAATNRNLKDDISAGKFREDLYFRLNVFPIKIPTLAERRDDIPGLVKYFLKHSHYRDPELSDDIIQILKSYSWPGNIRELKNILERATILAAGEKIGAEHIGIEDGIESAPLDLNGSIATDSGLEEAEKKMIIQALEGCNGNKTEAAKLLKISRRRLYSRMKFHGI